MLFFGLELGSNDFEPMCLVAMHIIWPINQLNVDMCQNSTSSLSLSLSLQSMTSRFNSFLCSFFQRLQKQTHSLNDSLFSQRKWLRISTFALKQVFKFHHSTQKGEEDIPTRKEQKPLHHLIGINGWAKSFFEFIIFVGFFSLTGSQSL